MNLAAALDAMQAHGVDVMLLSREGFARLVVETRRLWLAGTRPFAPGCVVVREPAAVHVLANSTDAIAEPFDGACLFGITWNPEILLERLTRIPGVARARRAAVDAMSPAMATLLQRAMPGAELVDVAPIVTALWSRPPADRAARVRAAVEVACAGIEAMAAALAPGVRPRVLRGSSAAAFAAFGVTTPAFEAVVSPVAQASSTWLPPERMLADGERVVLRAGALRDGWEGTVARTYTVAGHGATLAAVPGPWRDVIAACRAGARVGDLRAPGVIVYGAGRGVEAWDDDFVLPAGTTAAVEVSTGSAVHQDVVHVTEHGGEVLSAARRAPGADPRE